MAGNFETAAKDALLSLLEVNSTGDPNKLVNAYLAQIRRFRKFIFEEIMEITVDENKNEDDRMTQKDKSVVPTPTCDEVERYIGKWHQLEDYNLQEEALNKLFFELCPSNTEITDVLLKAATLNDFYSTNIFSIYPVARHILSLGIDSRLKSGDVTLVEDLKKITIGGVERNFYSFATKYCSHHNPLDFPIYDSYVDKVLKYFKNEGRFSEFSAEMLKNYVSFKSILIDFREYYGLGKYTLKEIDQYIWLLGKEYFPNSYSKKTK
ncbi:MAG: hypothetical protein AB7V37_05055 [Eubacteriaceae bacterium]